MFGTIKLQFVNATNIELYYIELFILIYLNERYCMSY